MIFEKNIREKIYEKCKNDKEINEFIIEILKFERDRGTQWKGKYKILIEKYAKRRIASEDK